MLVERYRRRQHEGQARDQQVPPASTTGFLPWSRTYPWKVVPTPRGWVGAVDVAHPPDQCIVRDILRSRSRRAAMTPGMEPTVCSRGDHRLAARGDIARSLGHLLCLCISSRADDPCSFGGVDLVAENSTRFGPWVRVSGPMREGISHEGFGGSMKLNGGMWWLNRTGVSGVVRVKEVVDIEQRWAHRVG